MLTDAVMSRAPSHLQDLILCIGVRGHEPVQHHYDDGCHHNVHWQEAERRGDPRRTAAQVHIVKHDHTGSEENDRPKARPQNEAD